MSNDLFSADFKQSPFWWEATPRPDLPKTAPPARADVVVIGSGYTGLSAALQTARAGRHTVIFDAEAAGWGCSTRNGGQISTSIKPSVADLTKRHGAERALAIHREGHTALDWIEDFVTTENIACDFARTGHFHAAHTSRHFKALAREAANEPPGLSEHPIIIPRAEQHGELGTDAYHGGVVYPRHAALDPAKFHAGLMARVLEAGAKIHSHTPVTAIVREPEGFRVTTPTGETLARDVIIATNGYTGPLTPWQRRRVIPIGSYIIATEPLAPGLMDRLFPTNRTVTDTCKVVYYYRPSPDRTRVLFGGRVSARETDPAISAPRLHRDMTRVFPELAETKISHSWLGFVAFTFDDLAHTGSHEGLHYAMGYCGSGVSMAAYLGMRLGQKVTETDEGQTAFDDLPFPSRRFYRGDPWFLPAAVAYYRAVDRLQWRGA